MRASSSPVDEPGFIGLFVAPLEDLGVPYMVTGAVASVIYGEPRFTRDIDIVLELGHEDAGRFGDAYPMEAFYVPPVEALREEIGRSGGHFNLIHHDTGLRADVYLRGDDPLHSWAFERRNRIRVESLDVWVAPIEYVILRKLEFYRSSGSERHLRDVNGMLRVSDARVDERELDGWVTRLDLADELEKARGFEE